MVYTMIFYVDGGCRNNGHQGAYGAAAAHQMLRGNRPSPVYWHKKLPWYQDPRPSNQRAEISAIILALEVAIEKYGKLSYNPYLDLTIYSDSRYAVDCMTEWIHKWTGNGWLTYEGEAVKNRDLIEEASKLAGRINGLGRVTYVHIPRAQNSIADRNCNAVLDGM